MSTRERGLDTEDPPGASGDTRTVSLSVPPGRQAPTVGYRPFPPWPAQPSLSVTTGRSTLANQIGRPIAPARKLVAAVLGTVAVFVMVFGLGLASWAIVVLGLAVLALSIALGVVNVVRRGTRAWVAGTAQVKAVSDPPMSAAYGRAELQIVVVAPGLPITEVLVRDPRVPVSKWPRLGETLPVHVDVEDMRRVRIDWPNAPDVAAPPPPGQQFADIPTASDPLDDYDDDLLGPVPTPPWRT